jgi:hypothetical protein
VNNLHEWAQRRLRVLPLIGSLNHVDWLFALISIRYREAAVLARDPEDSHILSQNMWSDQRLGLERIRA